MANAGYVSIKPGNIRNTIVCLAKRRREFNISDRYPFPTFTSTPELKGHQSSGALLSWQLVFYCRLENGHQEYQFVFFPKCIYVFLALSSYIRIRPAKLRIHNKENTNKIVGAPEFWCPGTKTLVPFQVKNRFFVLIWRMGFRNVNFSFFLSVFLCSGHFLVLSEHCQHKSENTIKKTPKKHVGAP